MKGKTSREERILAMAFLQERYPKTFMPPGEEKPLEVGIKGKLIAQVKNNLPEGLSLRAIYVALHHYCCTKEYKKARKIVGTPRLDLAGEVSSVVTEADLDIGRQHDAKKKQEKADKVAKERALEAKRREKRARLERAAAKQAAKETAEKSATGKPTRKSVRPNHKGNHLTSSTKTSFKSGGHFSAPRTTTKPTIIVRKKRTVSLPDQENKPDSP